MMRRSLEALFVSAVLGSIALVGDAQAAEVLADLERESKELSEQKLPLNGHRKQQYAREEAERKKEVQEAEAKAKKVQFSWYVRSGSFPDILQFSW